MLGTKNSQGNLTLAVAHNDDGRSELNIYNHNGKNAVTITSSSENSGGVVKVNNASGVINGALTSDGKDGAIFLSDRYGELGWAQSGKK